MSLELTSFLHRKGLVNKWKYLENREHLYSKNIVHNLHNKAEKNWWLTFSCLWVLFSARTATARSLALPSVACGKKGLGYLHFRKISNFLHASIIIPRSRNRKEQYFKIHHFVIHYIINICEVIRLFWSNSNFEMRSIAETIN